MISIHPPREGWDYYQHYREHQNQHYISIHPPREGWDDAGGGAIYNFWVISIHPPREGWDHTLTAADWSRYVVISIHPPREGWDPFLIVLILLLSNFNPPTP